MDYNNNSLEQGNMDYYSSNRCKHIRCHHHQQQNLCGGSAGSQHQQQYQHFHTCQAVNMHRSNMYALSNVDKVSYSSAPQHVLAKMNIDHFRHPDVRYRSSVSPAQTLSNCGTSSSNSPLTSGFCSGSSKYSYGPFKILRAADLKDLLLDKLALLPGSRSRRGAPLLCFPYIQRVNEPKFEDWCKLMDYLTCLPSESVRNQGFDVVIDMRNGRTMDTVKTIMKAMEQRIAADVFVAYVIRPENRLALRKPRVSTGKFQFEVRYVSFNELTPHIDPSQLTIDMEGTLPYEHTEWIEIRCAVEHFFLSAKDLNMDFDQLYRHICCKQEPATLKDAERALSEYTALGSKISQAPVSRLGSEAERLVTWLRCGKAAAAAMTSGNAATTNKCATGSSRFASSSTSSTVATVTGSSGGSGGGASFLSTWVSMNLDFQELIPQVHKKMNELYRFRTVLHENWERGCSHLDKFRRQRMFEEDANHMGIWLSQVRHILLTKCLDIGRTASQVADLHAEHRQLLARCAGMPEQIACLNEVATNLANSGHFSGQVILKKAGELEHEWKSLSTALEDRNRVLYLSSSFHTRAQSFLANCPHRELAIRQVNGSTLEELHQALITLQTYWQEVQSAHEEACTDGRALSHHLSTPVPSGSHNSLAAAVDYSEGRKHCTDLVHEIWSWFKKLEQVYCDCKDRLNGRQLLLLFKDDVHKVLEWLSIYGEPFLHRQTSVGKSIQRAEQLYNSHMQFEQVALNTLSNTQKLIGGVDELVTKVENREEVYKEADELRRRIEAFTQAMGTRRETLDLGCGFYRHTKAILSFFHSIREDNNPSEHLPATIEGIQEELSAFHNRRHDINLMMERVLNEGQTLISRLKDAEDTEAGHISSILEQITNEWSTITEILNERQARLDLCLQLRLFEADVHSEKDRIRREIPSSNSTGRPDSGSLNRKSTSTSSNTVTSIGGIALPHTTVSGSWDSVYSWLPDPKNAPDINSLEHIFSVCRNVVHTAYEALNKGSELLSAFDFVGVNFPAAGPGSSDSGVGDSVETAVERVRRLITELSELVLKVEELDERVQVELEWRHLESDGKQVLCWISECEQILHQHIEIPINLARAKALLEEREKFQSALNGAYPKAEQCASQATNLYQQASADNPHRIDYQTLSDTVANRWQKLLQAAEDRRRLFISAVDWYNTYNQLTSVLCSLEESYQCDADLCQTPEALARDPSVFLAELSNRHAEKKETFLKACTLARRTAESFSKYLHRMGTSVAGRAEVEEQLRAGLTELMVKEQSVLEAWAVRRRRLDDCIYFTNIKGRIEELLLRVQNHTQHLPSPNKSLSPSSQLGSSLLKEVSRACESLDTMINMSTPFSTGHITRLKQLYSRLQSLLPQPSTPTGEASVGVSRSPQTQQPQQQLHIDQQRKLIATGTTVGADCAPPIKLDFSGRSKKSETDVDRTSVSSTSSSGTGSTNAANSSDTFFSATAAALSGPSQEQRRLIRRREMLLLELIQTERSYIQALNQCIDTYRKGFIFPPKLLETQFPPGLVGKVDVLFGNLPAILDFHRQCFEPELGKYIESGDFLPEDVGHCFVVHSERLAHLYVDYCVNHAEATRLVIEHGNTFLTSLQLFYNLIEPLQSYLIKPVQRVTKYQLLLRELRDCCDPASVAELNEGLDVMVAVPKRANNALHLSMLQGLPDDFPLATLGDVILQDQFTVWEPKQLIKKSRERRIFLFDNCLIVAKESTAQSGEQKSKYWYKSRLHLAECHIKEHIEGDQCKFALWTGRPPTPQEYRLLLRASSLDLKLTWVRALREVMRERMFSVQSLYQHQLSGDSGNTLPSFSDDAELLDTFFILENYQTTEPNQLSVSAHQVVQLLHRCDAPEFPTQSSVLEASVSESSGDQSEVTSNSSIKYDPNGTGDWALIRVLVANTPGHAYSTPLSGTTTTTVSNSSTKEGFIPFRLIGSSAGRGSVGPHQASGFSGRRSSASGRRWLLTSGGVKRAVGAVGGGVSVPGKRGSKADLNQATTLKVPYPTVSRTEQHTSKAILSNDKGKPLSSQDLDATTILDNVSEESVDVELPPPMSELANLSSAVVTNGASNGNQLEETENNMNNTTHGIPASVDPSSRIMDKREGIQMGTVSASGLHRLAQVPEVAGDWRADLGNVPKLLGLPSGATLSGLGELRLHGSLSVAAKLVSHSSSSPLIDPSTPSLAEDWLRSALDHETLDELHFGNRHLYVYDQALVIADAVVEVLPITNESSSTDNRTDGGSSKNSVNEQPKLQCHFRHALPIGQLSILEDVGLGSSKPSSGDQLLWFSLCERLRFLGSSLETTEQGNSIRNASLSHSQLCYIVAPRSPETRARWLTELSSMLLEARRRSQAFLSPNSSSPILHGSKSGTGHKNISAQSTLAGLMMPVPSKMSSAASVLYPSGVLFEQTLPELPKLHCAQCSNFATSSPSPSASVNTSFDQTAASMLSSLHLTSAPCSSSPTFT